jgi:hypothetical protein
MANTPAGWYPDTQATGGERYWDGEQWTPQRRAAVVDRGALNLEGFGSDDWANRWVWLLPVVGFIQGLRMLDERPARGVQLMLTSVFVTVLYAIVIYALA